MARAGRRDDALDDRLLRALAGRSAEAAAALRDAQRWLRDSTGEEKRLRFEALLDAAGDGWLPREVAQACYMAVALDEPDELAHAAPTEWAAFGYVGA